MGADKNSSKGIWPISQNTIQHTSLLARPRLRSNKVLLTLGIATEELQAIDLRAYKSRAKSAQPDQTLAQPILAQYHIFGSAKQSGSASTRLGSAGPFLAQPVLT